eukprot:4960860-Pleurochrysis_carterae.AAC.1
MRDFSASFSTVDKHLARPHAQFYSFVRNAGLMNLNLGKKRTQAEFGQEANEHRGVQQRKQEALLLMNAYSYQHFRINENNLSIMEMA